MPTQVKEAPKRKVTDVDKIALFKNSDDVMKRILDETKKEIEKLEFHRENLIVKNRQLDDDLIRKQGQFEQWKRGEIQKLEDAKFKISNEVIKREKAIETGELDLMRRSEEVARREVFGIAVMEKEKKLNKDRLGIEKLYVSAQQQMDVANTRMSEADSKLNHASQLEAKIKEMEKNANTLNESASQKLHLAQEKEEETLARLKQLEEVKKIVEPQIKELKFIEEKNAKELKEIAEKLDEVNRKTAEDSSLLRGIEIREKKCRDKEKELNQKDEEITRKALVAGVNNG